MPGNNRTTLLALAIAAVFSRVNQLSSDNGRDELELPGFDGDPTNADDWHRALGDEYGHGGAPVSSFEYRNGMGPPEQHGAVVLEDFERARPELQRAIDEHGMNDGKSPDDPSYFSLPEFAFVGEASEVFEELTDEQRNTIALNTKQNARSGTLVGRMYAVDANGNPLDNRYAMTFAHSARDAARELVERFRKAIAEQGKEPGGTFTIRGQG